MRIKEKLKGYWHDLFYFLAPNHGVDFAMKCKDVTAKIDLGEEPGDLVGTIRFHLHLSLCRACHYYNRTTATLRAAVREMVEQGEKSIDVDSLNLSLLKKYSKS